MTNRVVFLAVWLAISTLTTTEGFHLVGPQLASRRLSSPRWIATEEELEKVRVKQAGMQEEWHGWMSCVCHLAKSFFTGIGVVGLVKR